MKIELEALPDYTSLKKLASALWQQNNSYHGAAVMVGAGFSRSAATTGDTDAKLPLWFHFSKAISDELRSTGSDPLRLAEEYSAFFGKQALHDLIKKQINDAAWEPGDLHRSLLKLPWSEVLTTNWDTLLERASMEVHYPVYNHVSKQEDLSSSRSPRIVKLHGTLNVTEDLIFTQEDYRKYPQKYAAFVNFARQIFIENELCLVGFSGDDPNFLQWAGWVRDNLATHSRRIYIAGALGLNEAKRKYLESINVAPIDLADLVADYDDHDAKHLAATTIFIEALHKMKPIPAWEWNPEIITVPNNTAAELQKITTEPAYAAKHLEAHLPTLEKERLSYPGWLICPADIRQKLQFQFSHLYPNSKNLAEMSASNKEKLLYEIVWRHTLTFDPIPEWMMPELLSICDPSKQCGLSKKQQLEISIAILKNSQWLSDALIKPTEDSAIAILEAGEKYWPDCANELAYYRAIMARDSFNYCSLKENLEKIKTLNPIWKLRKAALLAEAGEYEKGKLLISEAYRELLKQYRKDRTSIFIISRLAWAHWIMRGITHGADGAEIKELLSNNTKLKCVPWDHIDHLKKNISSLFDKQIKRQEIQPLFAAGSYRDNSNTISFNNGIHPLVELEGLSSTAGLPIRWDMVNFYTETSASIAELEGVTGKHCFSHAIRSSNYDEADVIKKVFSRTQIACMSTEEVNSLLTQCTQAISFWNNEYLTGDPGGHAVERLRVFTEVLARISVRATPQQAKNIFSLAVSQGKNPGLRHFWLFNSLNNLLKCSMESIPKDMHHELLLEALSFPLATEAGTSKELRWPNPVIEHPGQRTQNTALDRRLDDIIESLKDNSVQNADALARMIPLAKSNFLRTDETIKIAEKIWGAAPGSQKLPETGLFMYSLIELPAHDPALVKSLFRKYVFDRTGDDVVNRYILIDIVNASSGDGTKEYPSEIQALSYFTTMVAWVGKKDEDPLGFSKGINQELIHFIGLSLSRSIVPNLPKDALTKENFDKLLLFFNSHQVPEATVALVYFAAENNVFSATVEKIVRSGLQSTDSNAMAYASHALFRWRELQSSPIIDRLILRMVFLIGSDRLVGLTPLIWTAKEMLNRDFLGNGEIESLAEMLPIIFDSSDYMSITNYSRESVSVSLVREVCVKLAKDILNKSHHNKDELLRILQEAQQDSLPEVRFA